MPNVTIPGEDYLQETIDGVSVLIPCYNEENAIAQTVASLRTTLDGAGIDYEIIVIDDGSTDATRGRALEAGAHVLIHPYNMGYGNSIMDGVRQARFSLTAIIDADLTYPVETLPALIKKAKSNDMVIGARQWNAVNTSRLGRIFRGALYYLVYYLAGEKALDLNSGLRVFHQRDILRYRRHLCPRFSFTTTLTILFLLTQRSVSYISIDYYERVGSSKVAYFKDAWGTFSYIFPMAVLFQPYRMSLFVIVLIFVLNGVTALLAALIGIGGAGQMALHFILTMGIVAGQLAMILYAVSHSYMTTLQQNHAHPSVNILPSERPAHGRDEPGRRRQAP